MVSLVGHNGSGKSAILQSIVKLFGTSASDRSLRPSDFHVPTGEKLEDQEKRTLFIEVKLVFPELVKEDGKEPCTSIPEFFNQMTINNPGSPPYCLIRLDGIWSQGNTAEGDIEQKLSWITSEDEDDEQSKLNVSPSQRSQIHVYYVPAIREPLSQIKYVTGSIMHRLIRAINWSEKLKENHSDLIADFKTAFQSELGINTIQNSLTTLWKQFCGTDLYHDIQISPLNSEFKNVISRLEVFLSPSPDGGEEDVDRLSEGLRSLFYLSLIHSVFHIEEDIIKSDAETKGFVNEHIKPPYLTIFAVEEPENHLAPHYLGRITAIFRELSVNTRAQVLLTSHSSSILKRIRPEEVRHLKLDINDNTIVNNIVLPKETDIAYKYIRNGVQTYPEIYFAKQVILCEGDSEEIVLPQILEAYELSTDINFVSTVPLGGRHVNHLWRLLNQVQIPYITLLDYDMGRETGGWARIKYVYQQLLEIGKSIILQDGSILESKHIDDMHKREPDIEEEKQWIEPLKKYNVYFSYPLDFDFMMLKSFPEVYRKLDDGENGPTIPKNIAQDNYKLLKNAYASVLKKNPNDIIEDMSSIEEPEIYFWYRYLFLGRGKPVSHLRMVSEIDKQSIIHNCPEVIKEIITKFRSS